jgi:alpha-D-xyloside xylohydrolase
MKATNTLVEMGDAVVPIFGDPEREYDFLARVVSWRPIDGGVELDLESHEERKAKARFRFVTPEIVRVQYVLDREPLGSTPMQVGPLPAPPDVHIEEDVSAITVLTSAVSLRIDRRPFRWSLLAGGEVIAAQEVHDGALLTPVSMPAGWSRRGDGAPDFHETLALRADEQLFGLGESFGALNRRGTRTISWSRDTYGTNTTPLTYINIPFFWSTRGFGLFINQTGRIVYEQGYPSQVANAFRVEEPYLDYFVIFGPKPQQIIDRYWLLTGRGRVPPLWSFGVWVSRCMYRDAEQVRGVVDRLRALEIPVDVVNIDPRWLENRKHHERDACDFVWDEAAFGTPEAFAGWLREQHVRLCLWENPYVWRDAPVYENGVANGHYALGLDGQPAATLDNEREAVVFDFTNQDAVRWWQDQHRPLLRAGVSAFKTDYGEGVPASARFSDGSTGRETHNVFPLLYNRAVWDVIEEEKGEGEAVVFGRSGYAGSQRYPLNWVGDTQCTFEGMAAALRAGLSLSCSGIPFWSHDIGGFWNPRNLAQGPEPVLYIRWAQWGLLSSHARFHGIRGREPWWYGDEAIDAVRKFARLRHRLLPYLWSFANEAAATATPLVRPLVWEYADDPTTHHIDSEYLLGPWLLVAPVFDPQGRARVYLPAGRWFDFWSGEVLDGPHWLDLTVPLDRLPIFVRDDSLLPMGPEQTFVGERPWDPLEIAVRVSTAASLRIDGESARLDMQAHAHGGGVRIDLSGKANVTLRFVSPTVSSIEARGAVTGVRRETIVGALSVSLRLDGQGSVAAK